MRLVSRIHCGSRVAHTGLQSLFFLNQLHHEYMHQQPLTSYRPELNQEEAVLILSERGSTVACQTIFSRITPSERPGTENFISIVSLCAFQDS